MRHLSWRLRLLSLLVALLPLTFAPGCAWRGDQSTATDDHPPVPELLSAEQAAQDEALDLAADAEQAAPSAVRGVAPRRPLPRPAPPATDHELAVSGRDGVYLKGSTDGHRLSGLALTLLGSGRAGVIYDIGTLHPNDIVEDVSIDVVDAAADAYQNWGLRRYGLGRRPGAVAAPSSNRTSRVRVRGVVKEHGGYDEVVGDYTYEDVWFEDCGAQGLQIRLTQSPPTASPYWLDPKHVRVERIVVLECGLARGGGRAGFGISVKSLGPNGSVEIVDGLVQTINQTAAKVYNGRTFDSFGALIVESCERAEVDGMTINMKNPDRDVVQFFDYANKAARGTGPREILWGTKKQNTVKRHGAIAVREGDGDLIDIRPTLGSGVIKVYRYGTDKVWRLAMTLPASAGYRWAR